MVVIGDDVTSGQTPDCPGVVATTGTVTANFS